MLKIMSKGNWRNFYWIAKDKKPVEIVREGGKFYFTKYVIGQWLTAIGDPIKKFSLVGK